MDSRVPVVRGVSGRAADPGRASKVPGPRVESTYFLDPLQNRSELRALGGSQARSESRLLMVGELDNLTQPNLCTSKWEQ